jgi:hypothetical protein
MIKVQTHEVQEQPQELSFPLLVRSKHGNEEYVFIVLFTAERKGVILSKGKLCEWSLGDTASDFISVSNKECWEILPKGFKLTIEQE